LTPLLMLDENELLVIMSKGCTLKSIDIIIHSNLMQTVIVNNISHSRK